MIKRIRSPGKNVEIQVAMNSFLALKQKEVMKARKY